MRKMLTAGAVALLMMAPLASVYAQTEVTICDIQDGSVVLNTHVFVDSVIVTAIDRKPSTFGFWAQHPEPCKIYTNREYSGILVYLSYANPDTIGGVGIEEGDLVSVRGNYTEYPSGGVPSVSEITYPSDAYAPVVHIIQQDYGMPPAVQSTVHNFGTVSGDSANCEKWEGVWCMVDTVVCTEWIEPLEFQEWAVVEAEEYTGKSTDTLRVDDKLVDPSLAKPNVGDSLATIHGVFSFEYDNYKLWPRTNDDVVYVGGAPAPNLLQAYSITSGTVVAVFDRSVGAVSAANSDNFDLASVDVTSSSRNEVNTKQVFVNHTAPTPGTPDDLIACNVENEFGRPMPDCQSAPFRIGVVPVSFVQTPGNLDTSQVFEEQVTVAGIVTGGSDTFGGFYLGTPGPGNGPFSGVYVFDSSHNRSRGDSVIVSASVDEYYGLTEMYLPEYVSSPIFTMTPDIPPVVVDPSVLTTPSPGDTAEVWEGCLVKLEHVEVASYANEYGEWTVQQDGDTVHCDDNGDYTYSPVAGDSAHVAGLVTYAYEMWVLLPRDDDDITVYYYGAVEDETLALHKVELKSYPNPFNPKTAIEFGIVSPAHVKLTVYDVSGRLVRTLVDREMPSGTYQVHWNGTDSHGHAAAAGVYYCRFEAGDRVEMEKLVLVK